MKEKLLAVIVDKNFKGVSNFIPKEIFDGYFFTNENDALDFINKEKNFDVIATIGENSEEFPILYNSSFDIRKKWVNFKIYNEADIEQALVSTFLLNIERDRERNKLFSIFTCAYKTTSAQFERLYNSLKSQTYNNWNWWILDDSPNDYEMEWLKTVNDSRITVIRNYTHHGSIGFNKHIIAMACDGDYLVEVDHDDELTADCLECLYRAFDEHPDSKFVYSDTLEMVGEHTSVNYGDKFSCGQGIYKKENVNGWNYNIAVTAPCINSRSIRSIHAQPNHVRAWEKKFYHSINGHYEELSVCDDMELLIRTFLYTKMTHVNKVLYIQYELGRGVNEAINNNTQTKRFKTIQFLNYFIKRKYDKQIHERILELGFKDTAWNEEKQQSEINDESFEIIDYGYQFYPEVKM